MVDLTALLVQLVVEEDRGEREEDRGDTRESTTDDIDHKEKAWIKLEEETFEGYGKDVDGKEEDNGEEEERPEDAPGVTEDECGTPFECLPVHDILHDDDEVVEDGAGGVDDAWDNEEKAPQECETTS